MSHFDVPNNGYGVHVPPEMVFSEVGPRQLKELIERADELEINYQRWFVSKNGDRWSFEFHEELYPGLIVYFPQYNCLRDARHMEAEEVLKFSEFISKLRRYEKHSD